LARPTRLTPRRCATNGCNKVHLRFFVGGAEGDAFGTIVYNDAERAFFVCRLHCMARQRADESMLPQPTPSAEDRFVALPARSQSRH
jgi:hypothetical protein